jgi:beta-N-acetylhexosaminidase
MSGQLPLRHQVGQLFLVGLGGTSLTDVERAWLQMLRPGGVVLFRRNIEESAQTTMLLREATQAASSQHGKEPDQIPALRALDLEGGLVDRLRDLLGSTPSAAAVAATGRIRDARRHGYLIGRATRLLGFNTTFAPVLDLALPDSATVLQSRVYGRKAEDVLRYALPFLDALRAERVLGCGKHFPGLGGGNLDSHAAMPRIERSWDELWLEDMAPYQNLARSLPIVMVAHAHYPKVVESGDVPASVSRFWITQVLRRRMGYQGLVLTDDMEMGGLLSQMSIEEAAIQALLAGTDLLEICRDPALVLRAYDAVLREAELSASFRTVVRRACHRVIAHKRRLLHTTLPRPATAEQIARQRLDLRSFTEGLKPVAGTVTNMRAAAQRAPRGKSGQ